MSFYEDGRTRTVTLRAEEVEEVAAAVARYDAAVRSWPRRPRRVWPSSVPAGGTAMTSLAAGVDDATTFASSREQFDVIVGWLSGGDAAGLTHGELEDGLATDGRELLRLLLQDHLDLRAREEAPRGRGGRRRGGGPHHHRGLPGSWPPCSGR